MVSGNIRNIRNIRNIIKHEFENERLANDISPYYVNVICRQEA